VNHVLLVALLPFLVTVVVPSDIVKADPDIIYKLPKLTAELLEVNVPPSPIIIESPTVSARSAPVSKVPAVIVRSFSTIIGSPETV
jgi:hypothetical protein